MTPLIRIGLRVLAGYLIGRGVDPDTANILWLDDEVAGAVLLAISEVWYFVAKRAGWRL